MTRSFRYAFALALAWGVFAGSAVAQNRVGVRILLGVTDKESVRWDGSLAVRGAQVSAMEPWRFDDSDSITGNAWKAATHPAKLFLGGIFYTPGKTIVANGVVAQLSDAREDATIDVTTAQGNFSFQLSQIPYGKSIALLDGRVQVDRVPPVTRLTDTPEEQDYPSVALDKSGNAWLAYVEFKHAKDHNKIRADHDKPIKDFAPLKQPTGGDQILVKHYDGQKWGAPLAITEPGLDLYRTAIAADGTGRVWVFWSQNDKGNFDIWARAVEKGKPGTRVRITREAGADVDPVAVAASDGRVWVAWQGWRDGKASIFAASQQGSGFGAPMTISSSTGNEWNPAIAADRSGRVTVAWDSYRNGNYDIFMRSSVAGGQWGPETAVAATARYEAYPSLAYDPSGGLWVAYEEGGEGWGKDFGAYNTPGVALYQGRVIRLRGFEPSGRLVETAGDVGTVLPGVAPSPYDDPWNAQKDAQDLDNHRDSAKNRRPNQAAANVTAAHNNYPRLLVDASGRIWLAYRTIYPIWWAPMGTVWFEYVVSYDGQSWSKPVFLTHSDNLLDNRPALFSRAGGTLDIVGSSDWRSQYQLVGKRVIELEANMAASLLGPRSVQRSFPLYMDPSIPEDPYNNDLFANEISLGPASGVASVKEAGAAAVSGSTTDPGESQAAQTLRAYRSPAGLHIMRGEFHRHSEISMDGAWDGSIIDQYRYMIDAAKMDWVGCCDHDNGDAREYSWWISQKLTDVFHSAKFTPMFSYERSVMYPEGHRNMIFAQRGVRPLPRLPITEENYTGHAPDTQMLYAYLKFFDGVTASHTSATAMGTDWRDNDPLVEPVVEIYQGDRQNYEMPEAPRSNNGKDSIGGWRPKGFVNLALEKGYKLAFEASSDHISTHMSYCNLYVKDTSREAVLDAFKKRHVYAATDDILADVHSGDYMMGDVFTTTKSPELDVYLKGTAPFSKISIVKDNRYVYTASPGTATVKFSWRDNSAENGKTSYYYVRGEQANGEIVWASPLWITYKQ
jgi:hypothetical protein